MADQPLTLIPDDVKARFWAKVDKRGPDECWHWTGYIDRNGYGRFRFFGKFKAATHASILIHTGQLPPQGMYACHRCDNRKCVNPAHLFLGTLADNNADRDMKGRGRWIKVPDHVKARGSRHGSARLSEADIPAIRQSPLSNRKAAEKFGVTCRTIWSIRNGKAWRHVEG